MTSSLNSMPAMCQPKKSFMKSYSTEKRKHDECLARPLLTTDLEVWEEACRISCATRRSEISDWRRELGPTVTFFLMYRRVKGKESTSPLQAMKDHRGRGCKGPHSCNHALGKGKGNSPTPGIVTPEKAPVFILQKAKRTQVTKRTSTSVNMIMGARQIKRQGVWLRVRRPRIDPVRRGEFRFFFTTS